MKKFLQSVPTVTYVFLILGIISLFWHSGQMKLAEIENSIEIVDFDLNTDLSVYENKDVCVSGIPEILTAPVDRATGVTAESCVLVRNVEMYQYVISGDTVYKQFCAYQNDDIKGKNGEKFVNPAFPDNMHNAVFFGDVRIKDTGISVCPDFLNALLEKESGVRDSLEISVLENLKIKGYVYNDDGFYYSTPDPSKPEIGDVRISYSCIPEDSLKCITVCGRMNNGRISDGNTGITYVSDCSETADELLSEINSDAQTAAEGFLYLGIIQFSVAVITFAVRAYKTNRRKKEGGNL